MRGWEAGGIARWVAFCQVSAVAMAGVFTAAFARRVAICAGGAAKVLAIFLDVVAFADFAFAVGAGTFG